MFPIGLSTESTVPYAVRTLIFSNVGRLVRAHCFHLWQSESVSCSSHRSEKYVMYDKNCLSVFIWSSYCCGQIFNEFSRQFKKKISAYIKFNENPSSGSRAVPCGRTDRQKDTTKLIVAFRNFANAPKKNEKQTSDVTSYFLNVIRINLSCNIISVKCVLGFTGRW